MALPILPLCIGAACLAVARNKKKSRNPGFEPTCKLAPGARIKEVVSGGSRVVRPDGDSLVAVPPQVRRVFASGSRVVRR